MCRVYYIYRQIIFTTFAPNLQFYACSNELSVPENNTNSHWGTKKPQSLSNCGKKKEAWVGIEPTVKLLQSHALPLGYHALKRSFIRKKRKTYCKLFFACAVLLLKLSQKKKIYFCADSNPLPRQHK